MKGLVRKKEQILERERFIANAVGSAVFEKPRISMWMILVPILFLHFIYRMQKYKTGRIKFDEEFMVTRRRAMDVAVNAVETGVRPDLDEVMRDFSLAAALERPYAAWMRILVEYYMDLLRSNGDTFDDLVRSAFRNRGDFQLILDRLNNAEKEFYTALKPFLGSVEETSDIIATIESQSRRLRSEMACSIFQ